MLKASKIRKFFICFIILAAIAFVVIIIKLASRKAGLDADLLSVSDAAEYLSGFGWSVSDAAESEVTIPASFSDTYKQYNEIQKDQGFDLYKYRTDTVKKYTFTVQNYPGDSQEQRTVYANVLVFKGRIIGADITCPALDGFVLPVDPALWDIDASD